MRRTLIALCFIACAAVASAVEHPVSILGRVYVDTNCNGCIDSEDALVDGVNIQLQKSGGSVVGIAQTGEFGLKGVYAFPSDMAPVAPNTGTNYTLTMLLPKGYTARNAVPGPFASRLNSSSMKFNLPTSVTGTQSYYDFLLKRCGDFFTLSQCGWSGLGRHGCYSHGLEDIFTDVYGTDGVTIGGGFTMTFTSAQKTLRFFSQSGTSKVLTNSYVNPTGHFGSLSGELLALQLAVDLSDHGVTTAFLGDLRLRYGLLHGLSIREVLAMANAAFGGDLSVLPAGVTLAKLEDVLENINENFDGGEDDNRYISW